MNDGTFAEAGRNYGTNAHSCEDDLQTHLLKESAGGTEISQLEIPGCCDG